MKFVLFSLLAVSLAACTPSDRGFSLFTATQQLPSAPQPKPSADSNVVKKLLIRSDYKEGEVADLCKASIEKADARLNELAKISAEDSKNIENSLLVYEEILADATDELMPLTFMGYVSTDEKVRDEGSACEEEVGKFFVGISLRRDVYDAIKGAVPRYKEEARLLSETVSAFKKNGLSLSDEKLAELKALKEKLTTLEAQFTKNLNEDTSTVAFTKEELDGLSEAFLKNHKQTEDGKYIVTTKSTDYVQVSENAKNPKTRELLLKAYWNRAGEANTKLFEEAVLVRQSIATILGYKTWADYRTDGRMAENAKNVSDRLEGLKGKLALRNQKDLEILLESKRKLEDPNATAIEAWDVTYFANQVKKEKYNIDSDKVREYFPKDVVMKGLFEVYSTLLNVTYEEVKGANVWHPDVKLYAIKEKSNGAVLAYFHTDLFPREGKYGHAAAFPLISGRVLKDGSYSQPVASIVANFTPPTAEAPSLLTHDEVETLFHEFGHIMHQTLTRAPYASLSGSSVAQDFVEAPSQMLEGWVWNEQILTILSGHYLDNSKKLPADLLAGMLAAKDFNQGYYYTRQLVLGLTDLTIHTAKGPVSVDDVYNKTYESTLGIKAVAGNHFMATFGHMMGGYDAGYYSYIWSEVYAADMFTLFENDLLNEDIGLRYRRTILEKGSIIPALKLVEEFLQRPSDNKAFYKKLGI